MPRKSDIVRLNLRLTRDLYERLLKATQKNGTSLQTEIVTQLERGLSGKVPDQLKSLIDQTAQAVATAVVEGKWTVVPAGAPDKRQKD